jgi:type IV pilus assembly protein PilC
MADARSQQSVFTPSRKVATAKPFGPGPGSAPRSGGLAGQIMARLGRVKIGGGVRVKAKELAVFTRQFAVMIASGLPLVQALELLADQQENKGLKHTLQTVRAHVEGGATLSSSFGHHPKVFDGLYTNLVEAGEAGGVLEGVLQRLSTYIEKAVKLRRAVKSALIYPISVLVIATAVIIILLWKVVPIFATLFVGLDATMPLPTRFVIALSHFVGQFAWIIIVAAIGTVVGLKQYYATSKGREVIDALILKIPVLGILMRKIAVARFSRTLATLITSGVPMLESLDITARTAGNAVVEKAITRVRAEVEGGRTIADPLRQSGVFPNMVVQMVSVGEHTGALDSMLQKIADFYEEEVDTAVADLLTLLEPMIILFLGVVVGGVVISMYLPLFSLIAKMAG